MSSPASASSPTLQHVHATHLSVALLEMTPEHPPREETPQYQAAHHLLIEEKDAPCVVCQVRKSTLGDASKNLRGATQMETHHYPCERSLLYALDWRKVHARFPSVYSQASLELWIDSPENLLVLCDVDHRSPEHGIHHLTVQDWAVQQFLLDGYNIVARPQDAQQVMAADEVLEVKTGMEAHVQAEEAAPPAKKRQSRKPRTKATPAAPTPRTAPTTPRKRTTKQQKQAAASPAA